MSSLSWERGSLRESPPPSFNAPRQKCRVKHWSPIPYIPITTTLCGCNGLTVAWCHGHKDNTIIEVRGLVTKCRLKVIVHSWWHLWTAKSLGNGNSASIDHGIPLTRSAMLREISIEQFRILQMPDNLIRWVILPPHSYDVESIWNDNHESKLLSQSTRLCGASRERERHCLTALDT